MHPHSRSPFHHSSSGTQQRRGGRLPVTECSSAGSSLPGQTAYAASAASYATLVPQTCLSEDLNSLLGSVTSESHSFSPDLAGGPLDTSHVGSQYMREYSALRHSPEQSWDMFPSAVDLSRPEIQVLEAGSQRSSTGYNSSLDNSALQQDMYRDADPNSLEGTYRAPFERYTDPGAFRSTLDPSLSDYELPRIQGGGIHRSASNASGSSLYGHELSSGIANVDLTQEGPETTIPRYRTRRPSRSRSHRDRSSSTPYYSHREPNRQDFRPDARYSQGTDMLTPPGALPPSSQGYASANYSDELPFGLMVDGTQKKNIFGLSEGPVPGVFSNAGDPSGYGISPYGVQALDASQAYRGSRQASLSDSDQGKAGLNTSQARDTASSSPAGDDQVRVLGSQPKPQCWDHGCNGRTFSTFSNLLRHQREKSGTAAKSYCSKCGAEFTRSTAKKGHEALGKCKQHRRNS